ncbi:MULTISPECIES: S1C family serine protease [Cohnella]|uniref:S1C family serine protease n=1 Tax=Cohnella TaxID=329857 RepID=UPI0009BA5D7D|nr:MULTISPECIES: S1C family serine protease [Cohnella]MBN2981134.1 serine protease [Cohnella algarum]
MSFFDDDFFSTRVKRRSRGGRREWPGSFGNGGRSQASMFRVAIISSLVSSLAVALLFTFIVRPGGSESRPAVVTGQPVIETSERIITASAKVRPAVVSIVNRAEEPGSGDEGDDSLTNASLGSGVIFEKKGGKARIITNAHVIQNAAHVQVALLNGEQKEATIVGKDSIADLAVLEVDGKGIDTVAEIGDSTRLREGETVIAIGNPLGFNDSLTDGIVSNLNRIIPVSLNQDGIYDWEEEVIQISAPINPGNSGGALVNLDGELIGINSMKVADMGIEGIGFALPIHDVMPVVKELEERGKVLRPYLGVYSMDLSAFLDYNATEDFLFEEDESESPETSEEESPEEMLGIPDSVKEGVVVLEAVGPAKDAGLMLNDVIVKLDGASVGSTMELRKHLYNRKKIGETLTVTFYRGSEKMEIAVKLIEKDEDTE